MRQFIAPSNPDSRGILRLIGKNFRYFSQVLRVKAGDMVAVRLPDGNLQNMTVCLIDDKQRFLELQICDGQETITRGTQAESVTLPSIEYWLFQFIAKPTKMDIIIRQATECGVTRIIPVIGEYTQKNSIPAISGRNNRLERIITEARQQSGSPVNTVLMDPVSLADAVSFWKEKIEDDVESSVAMALYERNDKTTSLLATLGDKSKNVKVASLVVGSEGGISPDEISFLNNNGFKPIHFDTNILRCETAALYGIAALQSALTG